jgi:hypothetical protein
MQNKHWQGVQMGEAVVSSTGFGFVGLLFLPGASPLLRLGIGAGLVIDSFVSMGAMAAGSM